MSGSGDATSERSRKDQTAGGTSVRTVLASLAGDPRRWIGEWNWKAALTSSVCRGALFFAVNLTGGLSAASAALLTEFTLRGLTSGFYGSLTARFRHVEPRGAATASALVLVPTVSHSLELLVHWWRGTEALAQSITASIVFTVFSTALTLHLMRHGVMLIGDGAGSLGQDLRAVPRLLVRFLVG